MDRRTLLMGWGVSAVLLVAGLLLLLLTGAVLVGAVLFGLGALASLAVTVVLVRARARR